MFFIVNLGLGAISRIIDILLDKDNGLISSIQILIDVLKILLVITIIAGTIYIVYLLFNYYASIFYHDYQISTIEAMYHGFIDIYHIYDKIKNSTESNDIQVDLKRSIVSSSTKKNLYALIFMDLLGEIEGRIDSEYWSILSKPKKNYGRKVFSKKDRFPNPFRVNANYIDKLNIKMGRTYINYLVLNGFYNMKNKSDDIISPLEIVDIMK